jgi:hypothetical protein
LNALRSYWPWLSINPILSIDTILAILAWQPLRALRSYWPWLAINSILSIDTILAVFAWQTLNALLSCWPWLSINSIFPVDAVLSIDSIFPIFARQSLRTLWSLWARQSGQTSLAKSTGCSLCKATFAYTQKLSDTRSKPASLPQIQFTPLIQVCIPNPKPTCVLFVPGFSQRTFVGQFVMIFD